MRTGNTRSLSSSVSAAIGMFFICAISACEGTQPTLPLPDRESAPPAPRPISPVDGVVAGRQNDPTTGCPPTDATSGTGMRIDFAWEPVPGAVDYLGCFWYDGARGEDLACPGTAYPYRLPPDSFHTTEPRISFVRCSFSPDQFLGDRHWKVAARTADSGWGPYSAPATFRLPPCRLPDGRACFSPP
jgi:hypothetical protein